jgi:hypothetical protein
VNNDKPSDSGVPDAFDLVVTPDAGFVRYLLRGYRSTRRAFVFMGLLLMITSVGTFAVDGLTADGLWFLVGLWGFPVGVISCLTGAISGPRRVLRGNPAILAPRRYVFTADAIEWHTAHISVRLSWSAIKHVSRSLEAYRLERVDTNKPAYLCRTTLTPVQDEWLAGYFDRQLAARLAAAKPVVPSPPSSIPTT